MAETHSTSRAATPASVPLKRAHEEDHAPSVPSPLNPDAATRPRPVKSGGREVREKKDSLKKRESVGNPAAPAPERSSKKQKLNNSSHTTVPSPIRYNHSLPRDAFQYSNKDLHWASHEPEPLFTPAGMELRKPLDHAENKKAYRYMPCVADPMFSHIRYYRPTDSAPFGPRMSFEDSDKWFHFDESATVVTNEKGWRMGRANVVAREGTFYYEVKILRGVQPEGSPAEAAKIGPMPHVRVGWARREAPLDAPVGFDGYSYGLTDIRMEPMHRSRASKFLDNGTEHPSKKNSTTAKSKAGSKLKNDATTTQFSVNDHAREGDVIGMEITLPSLSLHRKIVDGNYNPAVDVGSGLDHPTIDDEGSANIVRDRFPVPYKGAMYFESLEYRASKAMEGYGDRGPFAKEVPSPNHDDPTVRNLPHSSIRVYKNGKLVGTAFRNLMAFLPPASQPQVEKGVRLGLDDGMLGYFPAVGVFSGGVAQVNFGPDFWYPPIGMSARGAMMDGDVKMEDADSINKARALRGIGERYAEQIAEDIVYDVIDEVDFFVQDGASVDSSMNV